MTQLAIATELPPRAGGAATDRVPAVYTRYMLPEAATSKQPLTSMILIEVEDLTGWPAPSLRPTTSASAQALEAITIADPAPAFPPAQIDDGFGI